MSSVKFTLAVSNSFGVMSKATLILNKFHYSILSQCLSPIEGSENSQLVLEAEGKRFLEGLSEELLAIDGVISIINIERCEIAANHSTLIQLPKKQQCKQILTKLFGETIANCVDDMTEENCVDLCQTKVKGLLGEESAKMFDNIT